MLATACPDASAAVLFAQSGPIGYWKLDEGTGTTTADSSGSGNAGRLVNSPPWSTGRVNSALSFDTNRYVTMGAPANLANLYTTGMSVSAWINPRTSGASGNGRIVDKQNGGAGWMLKMTGGFRISFVASEFATTDAVRNSDYSIVLGTWQHVVVTWTGSPAAKNINFYVNGVASNGPAGTNGAGAVRNDSATPISLGNRPLDAAVTFEGLIDDVRVYNRVLTLAEIRALADATPLGASTGSTARPASRSPINLGWTASTDNIAVTGYSVERWQGAGCSTFAEVRSPAAHPLLHLLPHLLPDLLPLRLLLWR